MKLKFGLLVIFFALYFSIAKVSLAETNENINYPVITPTSEFYPVKRLWEKVFTFILFTKDTKFNYTEGLLKERLSELKYVSEKRVLPEIENSSKRFAYQAGIIVEDFKKLNDKNKVKNIVDKLESYKIVLAKLRDLYSANSSFWMFIQQDIDTINILLNKATTS